MVADLLASLLRRDGPALSGDLARKMQEHGLSPSAARQRVSRGAPNVYALKGLTFPKRARFLYHKDDFPSERYWVALFDVICRSGPAYGAAVGALRARGVSSHSTISLSYRARRSGKESKLGSMLSFLG